MYLRDLAVFAFVAVLVVMTLRRPVFGVLGWVLFGVMNPHRLTWGPAFDFQFSQVIALATLGSVLVSREHKQAKGGMPAVLLAVLLAWAVLNAWLGFNPPRSFEYLDRVFKTFLFVWLILLLMHTRQHVHWLLGTLVFSLAYYGAKGGLFVIRNAGQFRVNGPQGSMIEGNNELAVGLIVAIPLIYYLSLQVPKRWQRWSLWGCLALCGMSVIGSYSRGAMLAIAGMSAFLWWRSTTKGVLAAALLALVFVAIPFMPEEWSARMSTIKAHDEDASASFRLVAWEAAYNLAVDRFPLGGGFEYETPAVAQRYSPMPNLVMVPHSVYFQNLGALGFIGLGIWLAFWLGVWWQCRWLRQNAKRPEHLWAGQLGSMVQVSIIGYAIGGTFLNLGYWDGVYYVYCAVAVSLHVVRREIKALQAGQPVNSPAGRSAPRGNLPSLARPS